ncbi:hypothetical protein ABEF93_002764 [Exophiala dermatitidis]
MMDGLAIFGVTASVIVFLSMVVTIISKRKRHHARQRQQAEAICFRRYAESWPALAHPRAKAGQGKSSPQGKANNVSGRPSKPLGGASVHGRTRPSARGEVDPWSFNSAVTLKTVDPALVNSTLKVRDGDILFAPRHAGIQGGHSWV